MGIHKKASVIELNKFINITVVRNLHMYIGVFIYIYMHTHLFSTYMYYSECALNIYLHPLEWICV